MSRTMMLVPTLAPASRQILAPADSRPTPGDPTPLPQHKLHGGGQGHGGGARCGKSNRDTALERHCGIQPRSDTCLNDVSVHCVCGYLLPPKSWQTDLAVFQIGNCGSPTCSHTCPRWSLEQTRINSSHAASAAAPGNQLHFGGFKIWPVTLGCLLWVVWRLSAQLDQCAALVVSTALRRPKPPRERKGS